MRRGHLRVCVPFLPPRLTPVFTTGPDGAAGLHGQLLGSSCPGIKPSPGEGPLGMTGQRHHRRVHWVLPQQLGPLHPPRKEAGVLPAVLAEGIHEVTSLKAK